VSDYIVGLTGGIGSGKSTVADMFVALGAALVDTDAIAHELTAPAGAAMPALIEAFGAGVADAHGALDRSAMRRLVFAQREVRERLESILHPMIRTLSAERCRMAESSYVILAVPLLVESGTYRERCDRILVVDCPESLQIERVRRRNGMTVDEVRAILAAQATRAQRLAIADDVLSNDRGLDAVAGQIGDLNRKYLQLAAKKLKASC
jgi:dephospho-CoA kinase